MVSVRWQRSQRGCLKCNFDASFSDQLNSTGIGICIRDDKGTFVPVKTCTSLLYMCSVVVGEVAFHHRRSDITKIGHVIS
jgi:hypothetical protein